MSGGEEELGHKISQGRTQCRGGGEGGQIELKVLAREVDSVPGVTELRNYFSEIVGGGGGAGRNRDISANCIPAL